MAPTGFGVPDCSECLALSTFWITNPDNVITNNVAAGSEFVGFWYIFPERPTGLSEQLGLVLGIKPAWTKMGLMQNNTAHSNKGDALRIDDGIKAGNQTTASPMQHLAKMNARYNPRVNFTDRASVSSVILKDFENLTDTVIRHVPLQLSLAIRPTRTKLKVRGLEVAIFGSKIAPLPTDQLD